MGFFKTIAGLLAVGGVSYGAYSVLGSESSDNAITIQGVIDGDTIDVAQDGETTRIRLLNIDTPEMGKECLAEEAKQYLAGLLPVGTVVTLEYDNEREDNYGRTLAGVFKEGSLINASVAEEGFAVPMKVGGNTRFFSEVSAAADRARAAGKGINSAGTECVFGDDGTYRSYHDARSTVDTAQLFQFDDMWNDEQFNGAHVNVSRVADAKKSISALEKAVAEQSDFQKEAFGHKQTELLDELDNDATEIETLLNRKITYASDTREKKHAEEDTAREAAEAAQREAEETARRAEQEATEAARRAEQEAQQAAPAYQAPVAPAPSNPVDNYTGCRAYNGNYAMTSIDKEGRPYAKIDCTTRVQIG
ncbi:nuclease [Corynebacterium guaraldiae]|nr:thermonuclease family protein [Corynebacterium guaraldiae]TRX33667.1 nuclease [Corynebacterium guaraldiae]TRX41658.1 nuclease [Corynebacterium guaraldiae]